MAGSCWADCNLVWSYLGLNAVWHGPDCSLASLVLAGLTVVWFGLGWSDRSMTWSWLAWLQFGLVLTDLTAVWLGLGWPDFSFAWSWLAWPQFGVVLADLTIVLFGLGWPHYCLAWPSWSDYCVTWSWLLFGLVLAGLTPVWLGPAGLTADKLVRTCLTAGWLGPIAVWLGLGWYDCSLAWSWLVWLQFCLVLVGVTSVWLGPGWCDFSFAWSWLAWLQFGFVLVVQTSVICKQLTVSAICFSGHPQLCSVQRPLWHAKSQLNMNRGCLIEFALV